MDCFIFAAGDKPESLSALPGEGDLVIAADAGYRTCRTFGIVPDLLVGDFDSMDAPDDFEHILRVPVEKDDTDTFLAAKIALEKGCVNIHLYGGAGGARLDHTLANLQMLHWLSVRGCRGFFYDRNFVYTAVTNGSFTVKKEKEWALLSVFCMGADAKGITITGAQYPLENAVLTAEFPLGVSNHILADEATVTVENGTLLICWERA